MAHVYDDTFETAVLNDETAIRLATFDIEGAGIGAVVFENDTWFIQEAAVIHGVGWWVAPGDLFETAVLNDLVFQTVHTSDLVVEDALLGSSVIPPGAPTTYESAVIHGVASSVTNTLTDEVAVLNDVVVHTLRATTLVYETAPILGFLVPGSTNLVYETAPILGVAYPQLLGVDIVYETAVLNDLVDWAGLGADDLDEYAVLSDQVWQYLNHGVNVAVNQTYARGYAVLPSAGDAWVTFTQGTGAMSRYENLLSAEIGTVDGVAIGVSHLGAYQLTEDGIVASELVTGITDFDDPKMGIDGSYRKHVPWVYAIGTADAAYQMRVMTDDNGVPVERLYAFPYANGAHPRNTRCKLGKLTWARYWQFAFLNDEPHTLMGSQADLQLTHRRV